MLKDLMYAVRMLANNSAFTLVAVVSLAIGIGANSAIFSFADALLLRPLPVPQPDRLVVVNAGSASVSDQVSVSYPDYLDLRDRNHTFNGLIAYQYGQFGYAPNPATVPELTFGAFVSGNFFQVLGVQPTAGRAFRPEEDKVAGRNPVVVLSHDFWLSHFNGSASAIGSKMRLNRTDFTVIGVAPAAFTNIDLFVKPALFLPASMAPTLNGIDLLNNRDAPWVTVKGRLKPRVTNLGAQDDLNAIVKALRPLHKEPSNRGVRVQSELALRVEQSPPDMALLEMLSLLAVCVLIVACANVVGLLLSRAVARRREISVRLALGAARWQLIRQLLLENLLLAVAGGVLGIGVALAGIQLFASIPMPSDLPIAFNVTLDMRVLLFTLVASVLSTFLFGLTPAVRTARADVVTALKARDGAESRGGTLWGRNVLVSGQLAVSVVLLIVAGVIFNGFHSQLTQGPGFRLDRLFLMSFDSQMRHYTAAENELFYKQVLDGARSASGVHSAALASGVPFSFNNATKPILPEGRLLRPGEQAETIFNAVVTDGYFNTLGIPVVRGRAFLPADKADTMRVAVINQHLATHFWPHQDAVGKRFHLGSANGPLLQVVGIARQAKYLWIAEPPTDFFYLPFSQNQQSAMTVIAEAASSDASILAPVLRNVVHRIDPNMPTFDVRSLRDLFDKRAVQTTGILVKAVFGMGVLALTLAVIGLYGVIAYSVSRRTREIGIRMAVGADRNGVLRMILREGFVLAVSGIVVGLVAGVALSRAIGAILLSSFAQLNPALFVAVALPLIAVALLGAYAPARRASLIDPIRALRDE